MKPVVADNYGWTSDNEDLSHGYLLPVALKHLKKFKIKTLLDIGTGNGATIPFWLSNGMEVSAMEPDFEGFSFAKRHEKADVRLLGVGELLPKEWENSFDAIICLEVVEHLFDPNQLIKTVKEALKNGGVAIVSTPYHGYWKNLALAVAGKWDFHHHPLRVGGHIKFWSRNTLTELFTKESFVECSFEGAGRIPFLWKSMVMVFRKEA
jgi:2-polyprenyl-3-methyl-5-hydroxy-6-metoxy-1,4-benzoquinol methylase